MRLVVVGAGKVGGYLAGELRRERHSVVVIELDPERARAIGEESDVLCLVGDGTDVRLLEEAEVGRADYLVAVTGRDEDNLVACQLARAAFGTPRVLARLNDPRNRPTFTALGVPVVAVTDLLVQVIGHEIDPEHLVRLALLGRGEVSLIEAEVPEAEGFPVRLVAELTLPPSTVLVAVIRGDELVVPGPRTEVRGGDRVLAVTTTEHEDEVRKVVADSSGGHLVWRREPHTPGTVSETGRQLGDAAD